MRDTERTTVPVPGLPAHLLARLPTHLQPVVERLHRPTRSCGSCVACCEILRVDELAKPMHTACPHAGVGCTIYPTRPAVCAGFACAWLVGAGTEADRPDRSGLMVDFALVTETLVSMRVFEASAGAFAVARRDPDQARRLQLPLADAFQSAGVKVMTQATPRSGKSFAIVPPLTADEEAALAVRGFTGRIARDDGLPRVHGARRAAGRVERKRRHQRPAR